MKLLRWQDMGGPHFGCPEALVHCAPPILVPSQHLEKCFTLNFLVNSWVFVLFIMDSITKSYHFPPSASICHLNHASSPVREKPIPKVKNSWWGQGRTFEPSPSLLCFDKSFIKGVKAMSSKLQNVQDRLNIHSSSLLTVNNEFLMKVVGSIFLWVVGRDPQKPLKSLEYIISWSKSKKGKRVSKKMEMMPTGLSNVASSCIKKWHGILHYSTIDDLDIGVWQAELIIARDKKFY